MIIDKKKLYTLWYENESGDKLVPDFKQGGCGPPKGFIYQHSRFPTQLQHSVLRFVLREEVDACEHPPENVVKTYGWVDGVEGRECKKCHGTQVKKLAECWPMGWDACGAREMICGSQGWQESLALKLANSGEYTLSESIIVTATCCERCMNALAHRYGLEWGYPEYSKDWYKTNTECDFCRGEPTSEIGKNIQEGIRMMVEDDSAKEIVGILENGGFKTDVYDPTKETTKEWLERLVGDLPDGG